MRNSTGELEANCEREVPCGILDMEGRPNKVRGVNCGDEMVDRMHPNFVGGYHNSGCDVPSGPAGFQGPQVMATGFNSMQGYKTQLKVDYPKEQLIPVLKQIFFCCRWNIVLP